MGINIPFDYKNLIMHERDIPAYNSEFLEVCLDEKVLTTTICVFNYSLVSRYDVNCSPTLRRSPVFFRLYDVRNCLAPLTLFFMLKCLVSVRLYVGRQMQL